LQSAISLFGKQGYHATTVPSIVRESGSSTGAFYSYFRNKEDVFAAALESIGKQIAAALNKAIAAAGDNALSQMRAAVESLVVLLARNPAEARILIVESSGLTPRLTKIRRSIIASHCRSVERALSSIPGSLPNMDQKVSASCWVGAIHESIYQWLEASTKQRIPGEALAREIARFNLQAIGAHEEIL
jgi:TetR/AcrR family fatty acid metabolism transcriptional regulator